MSSGLALFLIFLVLEQDSDMDCNLEKVRVNMVDFLLLVVEECDSS